MRHLALILFLSLFGAAAWAADGQCEFYAPSPELQPFAEKLSVACQALEKLCEAAPRHASCLTVTGAEESAETLTVRQTDLSLKYKNAVFAVVGDLFDHEPELYERKGHEVLELQCRTPNPLHQSLIQQVVAVGTLEHVNYFGDPYREENIYGELVESEQRARHDEIEMSQYRAAGIAYLAAAAFITATRSPRIKKVVMKSLDYMAARFRHSVPVRRTLTVPPAVAGTMEGVSQVSNVASPSIWAFRAGSTAMATTVNVPPSPAHMVRCGFLQDMSLVTKDMEAAWAEKDARLFAEVFSTTAGMGVNFVVGDLGIRYGDAATARLMEYLKNTKAVKVPNPVGNAAKTALVGSSNWKVVGGATRFLRVTPAGFVGGLVASEIIGEALKAHRLSKLEGKLLQSQELDAQNVLNELFQVFAHESHFVRTMMEFMRQLDGFGKLDVATKEGARLNTYRGNLSVFFEAQNRPDLTGAHFVQKMVCRIYDLMPEYLATQKAVDDALKNTDGAKLDQQNLKKLNRELRQLIEHKDLLEFRISNKNLGGLSWQFLEHMKSELRKYDKGLKDYHAHLAKMAVKYPEIAPLISERTAAVARWRNELTEFYKTFELPTSLTQELLHGDANMAPLNRIKNAVRRIYSIEYHARNPRFHNFYRCDEI